MSTRSEGGVACPVCGKPVAAHFKPFCSRRCADIDLGRWLKGGYAIPGETAQGMPGQPPGGPEPTEEE